METVGRVKVEVYFTHLGLNPFGCFSSRACSMSISHTLCSQKSNLRWQKSKQVIEEQTISEESIVLCNWTTIICLSATGVREAENSLR